LAAASARSDRPATGSCAGSIGSSLRGTIVGSFYVTGLSVRLRARFRAKPAPPDERTDDDDRDRAGPDCPDCATEWPLARRSGQSRVSFLAKSISGLVSVKGHFDRYQGTVSVDEHGSHGTLEIDRASLDTRLRKRDDHLRSADFFAVDRHPKVTFEVGSGDAREDRVTIDGVLTVKGSPLPLSLPVTVKGDGDRLRLTASTTVERKDVGLDWNRVGMIASRGRLDVDLVLEPSARVPLSCRPKDRVTVSII
jgi:polyisoprenoid-binding protein YceI